MLAPQSLRDAVAGAVRHEALRDYGSQRSRRAVEGAPWERGDAGTSRPRSPGTSELLELPGHGGDKRLRATSSRVGGLAIRRAARRAHLLARMLFNVGRL